MEKLKEEFKKQTEEIKITQKLTSFKLLDDLKKQIDDLKNSQNNSNQFKSIPRQLSQQNYNKNPEKELTYWESISKDIKEQDKYDMNLMKKSQLKKEDKTPNNLTNRNFINNNYNNCKFIFLIF